MPENNKFLKNRQYKPEGTTTSQYEDGSMVLRMAGSNNMRSSDNTETYLMKGGTNTNSLTLTDSNERGRSTAGFGSLPEILEEDTTNPNQRRTVGQEYSNQPQSDTRSTFPLDKHSPHRSSINRLHSIREEIRDEQTSMEQSNDKQTKTANDILVPSRISEQ